MKSLQCSILFGSDEMAREFDNALIALINNDPGEGIKKAKRGRIARFDQPRSRLRIIETDCPDMLTEVKKMAGVPRVQG